jgi:hypothetical protein
VFEMLPVFSCISWACAFRAGGDASMFFSGPAEAGSCLDGLALLGYQGESSPW